MGNDLLKNYNVEKEAFMQAGFKGLWSVFRGTRKERNDKVSIFMFEKKSLDKMGKAEREATLETLRKEAGALVKYRHPGILGIVDPMLEDKNTIAFVTEEIEFSLDLWLTKASQLEVKLVMIDLLGVLSFLHNDAKVIHNDLAPRSVFINKEGRVKLSGLTWSVVDPSVSGAEVQISNEFDDLNPDFRFTSPEVVEQRKCFYSSDIFSFGLLLFYACQVASGSRERYLVSISSNSLYSAKTEIKRVEQKYKQTGGELASLLNQILIVYYDTRKSANDLLNDRFFNDPRIKALKFVENLEFNEAAKNKEFLEKFPSIINHFEVKLVKSKFLNSFMKVLKHENLIASTIPAIFAISEDSKFEINFKEEIWDNLKGLFKMKQIPASALFFLMKKITFIGENLPDKEFSEHMLNIICKTLDCGYAKIQQVVINNMETVIKKIESAKFKNSIFPRLSNIVSQTSTPVNLKLQILKSFASVYSLLDQKTINDSLLTTLEKVRKADTSREVCITVVDVYQELAKVIQFENIANRILPNLIGILTSGNISKADFDNVMNLVQTYLQRIKENRAKVRV